jgi:carboxymethylenebutenolidase
MHDGAAKSYLYTGGQRGRGVVFLTDAGGIRRSSREAAARLCEHGYTVLMPNMFFRVGDPPFFTPPMDFKDPAVRATFAKLSGSLPPSAVEQDARSFVSFLRALPETAAAPLAVVGHCMSGAMALRGAAACPDEIGLAVSFHGGRLYTDAPDSPHTVLPRVKARLYFGHAVDDGSMPQEAIDKLGDALKAWGGRYENEVYEGALHSWTSSDSPVYHPAQAERAFQKLLALLADRF